MTDITVNLIGGESITVPAGSSVQDALTALLSNKQRKLTVAAKVGDAIADFTTLLNEDTVLTGRPEWTAGLVAEWQFAQRWQATLDYQYTGQQWAGSRHTGREITEELDDYHRVDWVLHWQPLAAWQLQLSVDNLLDEDYETAVGFTAPDRAVRFGVRFSHR